MTARRPGRLTTRALLSAYGGTDRAHVAVRLATCPFARIDRIVPLEGTVVDLACGHGHLALLLASGASGRRVLGVDIDRRKIEHARAAATTLGLGSPRTAFEVIEDGWAPDGPIAAAAVVDALYLFPPAARERTVRRAAQALTPGGMLLVKEMDTTRRVKGAVARAGEVVMTQVAGITASTDGASVDFADPSDIERWMTDEGLVSSVERWDRGYPVPHIAVLGRRPLA